MKQLELSVRTTPIYFAPVLLNFHRLVKGLLFLCLLQPFLHFLCSAVQPAPKHMTNIGIRNSHVTEADNEVLL
eukprot:COSAG02_NODE_421_length_22605_cov_158.841198_15_plen_73_part_00